MNLNAKNFEETIMNADTPVIVDFWASWCGPCRMLAPILEEFEKEQEGKVLVGKVNVDEEVQLATQFQIMSIPTILVFKDGKIVNRMVGVVSKEQLRKEIQ